MSQQATARWQSAMQAQNEILSNQSMMILGAEGEMFTTNYSFAGFSDVVSMFIMLSAGAAEIPVTKLFGRTITGLSQSNEGDERLYEGNIAHKQASDLKPQLESKLYPVIAMSTWGEVPDDLDIMFPSVRVMQEEEKADLADKGSGVILAAHNAGVISPKTTLKELRELSDRTGIFTNITDEEIEAADDTPQMPGEAMPGMGGHGEPGEGEPKPGAEENAEPSEDWRKYLPKSPSSQLHKASGISKDSISARTTWHGLDVSIETPAGSVRSGKDPDGKLWEVTMTHDYGYLRKTVGVDGDHVDVFLGPDHKAMYVYVVHTRKAPDFKVFDEDKAFLDFSSADHARLAFLANYDRSEHFGSMDTLSVGDFIDKVLATKERPKSITADALKKKTQDHVIGASFSPVFQDRFGDNGNCFNACLASLLEVELHDIPEFPAHQEPEFDKEVNAWLAGRGLTYKRVKGAAFAGQDVYHIIEGISPRGGPHACVGLNGRIIHDPHPAGGGLDKVERWGFLEPKAAVKDEKPSLLRRAVDALSKLFDDWKEEEHPREKGGLGGGQFTSGSGGGPATKSAEKAEEPKLQPEKPVASTAKPSESESKAPSPESVKVMEKYKNEQASNKPIQEYMEANGLTIDDYHKVNEALYSHNISSGDDSDKRLSGIWNSNSGEGKAMRLMSAWQEWQVKNGPRSEDEHHWDYARKAIERNPDAYKNFVGSNQSGSVERFKQYMNATERGEKIFYRKGGLDHAALSTTTNPEGATSGSSGFQA